MCNLLFIPEHSITQTNIDEQYLGTVLKYNCVLKTSSWSTFTSKYLSTVFQYIQKYIL